MLRLGHRRRIRANVRDGLRFCDSCAAVTTAHDRAHARLERTRTHLAAIAGPR